MPQEPSHRAPEAESLTLLEPPRISAEPTWSPRVPSTLFTFFTDSPVGQTPSRHPASPASSQM